MIEYIAQILAVLYLFIYLIRIFIVGDENRKEYSKALWKWAIMMAVICFGMIFYTNEVKDWGIRCVCWIFLFIIEKYDNK